MNTERTQAYGRVVRTLQDLGPTKLQELEQDAVRDAADTLIFTTSVEDDAEARAAIERIEALAEHLVDTERWTEERARELVDDVLACGPVGVVTTS
jgi:hypothetical protein